MTHWFVCILFVLSFGTVHHTGPGPDSKNGCQQEQRLRQAGLVDVRDVMPGVVVDLRYSGTNNFLKKDIYECLQVAFVQPDVGVKLKKACEILKAERPDLRFCVYDAGRPKWAQQALWDHIDKPEHIKPVYVADPKKGSIHNYGAAIDLTLMDMKGVPVDMGTPYDFFGLEAQPRCEEQMVAKGVLTHKQVSNRKLLRQIMKQAGFLSITSEWWHFNSCSLASARKKYAVLL
ncbi:MAG TPA: M15 family metallopeptidase [Catalimonadaceae bacterium]|nr:M15 family metallopeptidase [Catalimonadaceae bacterium]